MQQTTSYLYAAFNGRGQINVNLTLPYHHRVKQFGSRSGPTFENVKCTHCCSLFRILYCVFIDKRYICIEDYFMHTIKVSNSLDPDQTRHCVWVKTAGKIFSRLQKLDIIWQSYV